MAQIKRPPGFYDSTYTQRLPDKQPLACQVVKVCDGDTICVSVDQPGQLLPRVEYVRLAAIDAPELRGPERGRAIASRDALARLIELERVTVTPARVWRDPYHRIIARVTLAGVDVGTWLVDHGFAAVKVRNKAHTNPVSHSENPRSTPRAPASRHPH